ncbi:autotransporter outer membrane beta-barrel domain-containing protein [Variovorax sp. J22R133]|uniref:autotransporter outer membrane beta-barrel domain-containing protein n=1 Tax=Variovorax brevis TaxID=3053503 RepID=UPI0025779202|nr:autotransporter outer membrane beta-barrel domain-containing protein [Variovorax sp. J22R133]MDM0116921.1 autotransporter outer membrane beta-barrel domain-containing protein [Variovorax sp. J22R133]
MAPAQAQTIVGPSTSTQTLSTDTAYWLNPGTSVSSTTGDALIINGIAPVTFTNGGTVNSSTEGFAAAFRFNANGSLVNQSTGQILGHTYGVVFRGGGPNNNITNFGDVSARVSQPISYEGSSGGTVENFGTINSGAILTTPNGIWLDTTGTVTINNHAGATIVSGTGHHDFGVGVYNLRAATTINNEGTILGSATAAPTAGILFDSSASSSVINNSGVISGVTGVLVGNSGNSIFTAGTIGGSGGVAVSITGSSNTLTLGTGSVLNGDVSSTGANNVLQMQGTGSEDSTITGLNSLVMAGTAWTLSGAVTTTGTTAAATSIQRGTLTMTGALTNRGAGGGTTIASGAALKIGNGGTTGSVVGNVIDDGTLAFNRSNTLDFSGVISGSGAVSQNGTGTTVLTGTNTYTGGTTISAGILQLGNGGTSGSIVGNVTNNAALTFNRADALTFGGVVSGTGSLTQAGTGTLTLTGANSYAGITTISAGTVQIGAGGTSGTITGNIVDNGALVYGRSDARTYGGVISGTGTVTQAGNGILTLSGSNTYTGLTSVNAGVLAVNGTVAGSAQINTGATLRGTGTVAGQVNVADGGHLSPGNSPGTFNVGTLVLNPASQIDYELGLPGQVGATQNDLTNVAVNLTLDGTLNLANLGGMSPGTYRVFNYSGTLTDNGLAVTGSLPARFVSSDFLVDTATPGQVNLIVQSGGFALQYWDGVNTTSNNAVDGGTSTWNTTTTNWTNAAGTVNAPWQSGFAVFQGIAGTVTLGQNIAFEGMEFRTTGYTIEGGGFTLAGEPVTIIRVDPLVTATINAPIVDGASGATRLVSADTGLLVLGGANTYSGGTAINGGSVQVGADGNLGAASGGLSLNKGTLVTSASFGSARSVDLGSDGGTFAPAAGTTLSLTGPISGLGMLTQGGSGTLVLAGANSYAGGTLLGNGVLAVSTDANLGAPSGPLEFGGGTLRADADLSVAATRPVTFDAPGGRIDTNGHTATIAQTIDGSGGLTKLGSGTLVLAGNNAYEGGTTISAGTLQVGNGGSAGSVGAGDVINNGFLAFNRSDTSTVSNAISGAGALQQNGPGTTVLTGTNTYTGGTTISGGTLQLGDGGATGSITGNVTNNNGTLAFNRNDFHAFDGVISGSGGVSQTGTGTTVLSGANTYSGATTVAAGTLRAASANAFSANSAHIVAQGATLHTGGFNQRVAALDNAGTVSLVSATAGSTLTVTGAYIAHSLLRLGTQLGADGSLSDRLVLDGPAASASGNTSIQITNLGGLGALTTGNGIEVVSGLNGATTTAQTTRSAFSLANGHVDAGAYEYRLYAADAQGAGENWYLRSTAPPVPTAEPLPTFRAEVPLLAALPAQLRQGDLAILGNLHRRIGDEAPSAQGPDSQQGAPFNTRRAWGRVVYTDLDIQQPGVAQVQAEGHVSGLQAGTDLWASGYWRAGVYVGYLDGAADVTGNARGITARVGRNDLQSRYLGGYATWMDASGLYVDSVLQGGSQRFTMRPDGNPNVSGKASSFTASVEAGKPFALSERWSIEPQAQIAWQHSNVDDMVLSGAQVHQDAADGWIGRLGLRIKGDIATGAGRLEPYARVNLYRASYGGDVVNFIGPAGSIPIESASGYSAAEVAAGATLALTPTSSLYGEIGHLWDIGGDASVRFSVQASLGIKVRW